MRGSRRCLVLIFIVAFVSSACSGPSSHRAASTSSNSAPALTAAKGLSGMWSAKVAGTNAFVAVVANGEEVVGYICDSAKVAHWFRGTVGPTGFDVSDKAGDLTASMSGSHLVGIVTLSGGATHTFDGRPVKSAPLFRAAAGTAEHFRLGGWIVVNGQQRGAFVNTNAISGASSIANAPTLNLTSLAVPALDTVASPIAPDTIAAPTPNKTYKYVWAAAGDDWASGEGDKPTPAAWGTGQYTPGATQDEIAGCHRSDRAGAPQAQEALRRAYPEVDFRFLFVACSGARTTNLTTERFAPIDQAPQLDRVQSFAAQEGHLDALYMSIGANDAGLTAAVADCIVKSLPSVSCANTPPAGLLARLGALPAAYDNVAAGLSARSIGPLTKVFVSTYPDLTRSPRPDSCLPERIGTIGDLATFVAEDELTFLRTSIEHPLNQILRDRAAADGWSVIDGHEASFAQHGLCSPQEPWLNTNSVAVDQQGNDLPVSYPPGPGGINLRVLTQSTISTLTALSPAERAFLSPQVETTIAHGDGAQLLRDVSAGMFHPNDRGQAAFQLAIVNALVADVEAKSAANARLLPPSDVRIGAVVPNGNITLRWHDTSNAETRNEIEATPIPSNLRNPAGPIVVNGSDVQEFVHVQSAKAEWQYRVRACNANGCSAYSAPAIGINYVPGAPTAFAAALKTTPSAGGGQLRTITLSWNDPDAGVIEHVFRVHQVSPSGATTDVRVAVPGVATSIVLSATTAAGSVTPFPKAIYEIIAASCSRAGCSPFSPKVTVDAR